MNGAEFIAAFLSARGLDKVFLMTGGACAFMVDAISRQTGVRHYSFQHEQASAMAADAVWRTSSSKIGVTMATSGPGAMNMVTGIACSFFDSIPTLHITGQVNMAESTSLGGASVRQIGFQETDIVSMVKPITKYAVQVRSKDDLVRELPKALGIAMSGRMGPVLIDVPMDLQKLDFGDCSYALGVTPLPDKSKPDFSSETSNTLEEFISSGERPMVLVGAGVGLAGVDKEVSQWLDQSGIPFATSWNATSFVDHNASGYCGNIGIYGNRGANFVLQNCDRLLVLGSRLDNRQRTGNASQFAPHAQICVIDIDPQELKKYSGTNYQSIHMNLADLGQHLEHLTKINIQTVWSEYICEIKSRYFQKAFSSYAIKNKTLCPYDSVRDISAATQDDAIIAVDTGATVCWVYQAFGRKEHNIFTDGGCSAMGYSLPAAIAAKLENPESQVICIIGDGGFMINIQELQTVIYYDLEIKIIIFNNHGYGIIRQFQDSYLDSRYEAVGHGDKHPDIGAIANAWGISHTEINKPDQITPDLLSKPGAAILEIMIDDNTPIEPKLEMGRPINDQYPYLNHEEYQAGNRFFNYARPPDKTSP